jgi:hypothetical protein
LVKQKYWKILEINIGNIGKYWKILENIGKYWNPILKILENIGIQYFQYWVPIFFNISIYDFNIIC